MILQALYGLVWMKMNPIRDDHVLEHRAIQHRRLLSMALDAKVQDRAIRLRRARCDLKDEPIGFAV
jgi:hypothetical protein